MTSPVPASGGESTSPKAKPVYTESELYDSPEKLAILRRGEYAMESEHRSWMRLMMEAEWFG